MPRVIDVREIPWFTTASRRKRWLVGVSGGADSVALLHLLVEAGFRELVVCHLDHGLRGRASTEDSKFVARLAGKHGLPCEIAKTDVSGRMISNGESMETAARNARHDFFGLCAGKFRCPRVLLAHHADDQAETALWNLLRGSHGMKGMRPCQEITTLEGAALEFHRPLLAVRRTELLDWLGARRIRWREDASNGEPIAVRNRLRHEAMPLLGEISGRDVTAALVRGVATTEEWSELESWAMEQANVLDPQGRIHLPVLRSLPRALQRRIIVRHLKAAGVAGIDRALIDRVLELMDPQGSPVVNLPQGARFRRRAGRLFVEGGNPSL